MRHGKKFNHLGRTKPHREAMLSNMACSLIEHKRINTTVAKAKALRTFIEPLITKSKSDSTHSRRMVFRQLNDKTAVADLFREVAPKVANRPGGYTRIIRTGYRLGDNAEMCMVELVDFNEVMLKDDSKPGKSRRRRKKSTSAGSATATSAEVKTEETVSETKIEEKVKEAVSEVVEKAEAKVEEVKEKAEAKVEEVKEKAEAKVEEVKEKAEAKEEEVKEKVEKLKEKAKDEEKPKAKKSEAKKDTDSDKKE